MLLGHNWVTNGSYLQKQGYYKSDIGVSDCTVQESGQKWTVFGSKWVCLNSLIIVSQKLRTLHANCTQIARNHGHGETKTSSKTARLDLNYLVEMGIFVKEGTTTGLKFKLTSVNFGQKGMKYEPGL